MDERGGVGIELGIIICNFLGFIIELVGPFVLQDLSDPSVLLLLVVPYVRCSYLLKNYLTIC